MARMKLKIVADMTSLFVKKLCSRRREWVNLTEQGGMAINPAYSTIFQICPLKIPWKKAPPLWKKIARQREAKDRWVGTFFLFIIRAREIIRLTVANVKVSIENRLLILVSD